MKLDAPAESPPTIGVAPLLDIVFLLLVFFMVTTSFRTAELPLELAHAESATPSADRRDVVLVEISASGTVHLGGEPVADEALGEAFAARSSDGGGSVVVRADEATPHGRVVTVLDLARRHGLADVSIAVDAGAPAEPLATAAPKPARRPPGSPRR